MGKKNFFDLETQLKDTLKNTFDAINFDEFKDNSNNKSEVKTNLNNNSKYFYKKRKNKRFNRQLNRIFNKYRTKSNITPKYKNKVQIYVTQNPVGRISGILYMIFGFIGIGLLGSLLIMYSIFTSFFSILSTINLLVLGLLFFFFTTSIILSLRGIYLRKRVNRFKDYVETLDNTNYCSIEKLAFAIKKNKKFVVKDLIKMIDLGMFTQAHISDDQNYFMLNDEVYENYLSSQASLKYRKEEDSKKQEELSEEKNDPEKKELRLALEFGKNYIEQIKNVYAAVQREEIASKLYKHQNIVSQILNYIEVNPQKLSEVNKFSNNYLPITLKLVNTYKTLNNQPVQGENIKNAKNEIEKSIDIINIAFEKLLDDLYAEITLDISTDISVLETLFKQEGLTKNDFKK